MVIRRRVDGRSSLLRDIWPCSSRCFCERGFCWPIAAVVGQSNGGVVRKNGQGKRERAALWTPARGPDAAALSHHQLLTDIQSQSEPLATGFGALRHLVESFENLLCYFGADTDSGVGHFHQHETGVLLVDTGPNCY